MRIERNKSPSIFLDVLFALAFVGAVRYLPPFEDKHWTQLPHGILSLLASEPVNLTRVGFGLILVGYCWVRKNTIMSGLEKSDAILESSSIASVALLFLFLYSLVADPTYIGGAPTLLLQSASYFIASLLGHMGLRYAIAAGLTAPELRESAESIARIDLSNPLTALVATALSWSGLVLWTVSWFVLMPSFAWILGRSSDKTRRAVSPPRTI